MGRNKALLGCLRLISRFPLHLAAAFLAAIISDVLLTIQPMFLRAFIDQAQAGVPKSQLWVFPGLMAAGAVLAYAYDFISVAIRYLLQSRLSRLLQESYIAFGDKSKAESVRIALRSGLPGFARLALSLTLDVFLILLRLGLILLCLALARPGLGVAMGLLMVAALALTTWSTSRIGRISKVMGLGRERLVSLALKASPAAARLLPRLSSVDRRQFGLSSLNFLCSFILFRLMPLSVLAWYLAGSGLSLGDLASTFLYFSMLRGPYLDLSALLQDSAVSLAESSLFRSELDHCLEMSRTLVETPLGIILDRCEAKAGCPLSRAEGSISREFYDDLGSSNQEKARVLASLAERAREQSLLIHSEDRSLLALCHFVRDAGGLRTVLSA